MIDGAKTIFKVKPFERFNDSIFYEIRPKVKAEKIDSPKNRYEELFNKLSPFKSDIFKTITDMFNNRFTHNWAKKLLLSYGGMNFVNVYESKWCELTN